MDNITHTLTGVFLARAGLKRVTPQATLLAALAANAPDIDVVSYLFGGSLEYLCWHRGITHSLFAIPVMALLALLAGRVLSRGAFPWRRGYLVCLAAAATHPLLDWTNVYGVRLLAPLREEWYRLDITYIVDLMIGGVFALALAGPAISRLVSMEIGARGTAGKGWAWAALLGLVTINGGRYVLHERAVNMLDAHLYEGEAPQRVAAFPRPANPLVWDGLVETSNAWRSYELALWKGFEPAGGRLLYKPEMSEALAAAQQTRTMKLFFAFSQFPLLRVLPAPEPEGAVLVEAQDLRFGLPPERRFVAWVLLSAEREEIESGFAFGPVR